MSLEACHSNKNKLDYVYAFFWRNMHYMNISGTNLFSHHPEEVGNVDFLEFNNYISYLHYLFSRLSFPFLNSFCGFHIDSKISIAFLSYVSCLAYEDCLVNFCMLECAFLKIPHIS